MILVLLILLQFIVRSYTAELSTVYSFDANKVQKTIALTFDDGPHGTLTPRLLDILKSKSVKATFFVMGVKAVMHPDILKRAHDEGHEIANHVWDHPVLSKIPREKVQDQIDRTNTAIQNAISELPKVMRPPYGNTNKGLNNFIYKSSNLKVILWSYDTNDWRRPAPGEIVSKVVANVKPGTVLLCHDIHPGTIEAMPELVDKLLSTGFKFATVSELVAMEEGSVVSSNRYLRARESDQ